MLETKKEVTVSSLMAYLLKISLTSPTRPSPIFDINQVNVTGTFPLFAVFM
jgi:hypothetical protein